MDDNPNIQDIIDDLNSQAQSENRFIGSNPPPR